MKRGRKYVTDVATDPAVLVQVNLMLDATAQQMEYLYFRWQDEREYEDFADYGAQMQKIAGEHEHRGVKFVRAMQKPFGFVFTIAGAPAGATYAITCLANGIQWKRKS